MKRFVLALLVSLAIAAPAVAGVTVTFRPGDWTDVARHPQGYAHAYASATTVSIEVTGSLAWQQLLPEPTLYLREAVDQRTGRVVAIAQGNASGAALLIEQLGVRSLGPSFGQNAVAISWDATAGFQAYVQTSPTTYDAVSIDTGDRAHFEMPATSQGFRDVVDGELRRGDDFFRRTIRGYSIHEPSELVGPPHVWAGQWSVGAPGIGVVFEDRDLAFTAIAGIGFEPHIAALAGNTFAIAARTPAGAALAIVSEPYPANEPVPSDGEKPPPPTDPIDPPAPQLPPDDSAIAKAEADRHPDVLAAMRSGSDACDARRSQGLSTDACEEAVNGLKAKMTRFIAFAVHQVHPNWGLRRKDAGAGAVRPQDGVRTATDVLMWRPTGQIVDVVSDRGAGGWGLTPGDTQPLEQWVEPLAEPGDTTPPTGGGGAPADPSIAALKARVAALEQQLAEVKALAAALGVHATELQTELDGTKDWLKQAEDARDFAQHERDDLARQLAGIGCEAKVPPVLKQLGIKVGCAIVRPR